MKYKLLYLVFMILILNNNHAFNIIIQVLLQHYHTFDVITYKIHKESTKRWKLQSRIKEYNDNIGANVRTNNTF